MEKKNDNRRVRMTKRLMKDALLELLNQKELVNISVTAICEKADLNRSTFYQYYAEPAGLLREIEQNFLDRIPTPSQLQHPQDPKQILAVTAAFFDFIRQNEKTFRILFNGEAGSNFTARLVEFLCTDYIPVGENQDETFSRFVRVYMTNGAVGMMREWVYSGFPVSSQKIAEMMYTLSRKVIL